MSSDPNWFIAGLLGPFTSDNKTLSCCLVGSEASFEAFDIEVHFLVFPSHLWSALFFLTAAMFKVKSYKRAWHYSEAVIMNLTPQIDLSISKVIAVHLTESYNTANRLPHHCLYEWTWSLRMNTDEPGRWILGAHFKIIGKNSSGWLRRIRVRSLYRHAMFHIFDVMCERFGAEIQWWIHIALIDNRRWCVSRGITLMRYIWWQRCHKSWRHQ